MNPSPPDPKAGERAYYARLDAAGRDHARRKPFSDERCGCYLTDAGALLQLMAPAPRRVLELGCGTGWLGRFLARAGHEVTGLDIAPEAVAAARELAAEEGVGNIRFEVGDYESVAADAAYDYVLFYDALHHAEDEAAALRAAWRALRPDGALVCFEPGSGHSGTRESRHAVETYGVHEKDMPPRHIAALGRAAGFRRWTHLPSPHDLVRCVYRRDYHTAGARLWLEKLWGTYRAVTRLFRGAGHGGVTVLWK